MPAPHYVRFPHGLGDCSNFALVLRVYRAQGFDVRVVCAENKHPIFAAAGIPVVTASDAAANRSPEHPWWEPGSINQVTKNNILEQNKVWRNFKENCLPKTDLSLDDLWAEIDKCRDPRVFEPYRDAAAQIIADLPRPLILLHSHGNTSPGQKDMPANMARDFSQLVLNQTRGSVVLLDWDNRVSWAHSSRVRHINEHYDKKLTKPDMLLGLIAHADLLVGIDSGPFHLAGLVDAPSIGVWFEHHPMRYCVPRKNCVNIVKQNKPVNLWGAQTFNIVQRDNITPEYLFDAVKKMLAPPALKLPIGEDVQLQLLLDKCAGGIAQNTRHVSNSIVDRHQSFRVMFDHLVALNRPPVIIETGCIRADNDWAGAGYSTFLFGLLASRLGGVLHSIDLSAKNIEYAKTACATLRGVVFHVADSVAELENFSDTADLIYLDSMDANVPGHEAHGLKEAQQSVKKIKPDGLIVFDDTMNEGGKFFGKGALGVPWLLENGWKILFMGHQIVLKRA